MKIDNATLSILKNFAKINPSITIFPGKEIKTVSQTKTILGWASVETDFPVKFSIYALDRFISTLSLFNDPDLEFGDKSVRIKDGGRKVNYVYASEDTIQKAPANKIKLPSPLVNVTLTNEVFKNIDKAHGVLGLADIIIAGDGEKITIQSVDMKNPSADVYSIDIGETTENFKVVFKYENLKLIPADYDVTICKGISYFKSGNVEYWIAVEDTSTYS